MEAAYIKPFISAAKNVFNTMIDMSFTLGKPSIKQGDRSTFDVSGVVEISGDVVGCVVVGFTDVTATKVGSALLGIELIEVNSDCIDAIGEVTNMIAGDAKKDFPKENTTISVPNVVIGNQRVAYPPGLTVIAIPCQTDAGPFEIDVALREA